MNTGLATRKKKEIIDLFTNFNRFRSKEESIKVNHGLYEACRKGDLDLIYITRTGGEDEENGDNRAAAYTCREGSPCI
ncbi:hypothetical protein M9Y10_029928 [Tritrichomonas musculus]|uniref:Uncharacterized protein n=1 Tax=Tritrichomonas musculus TaxID=1915356 RepID=A0ABR2KNF3_9EUKA